MTEHAAAPGTTDTEHNAPPHTYSLVEAARALSKREVTASGLLESCLRRIDEREPAVGAWEHLDREQAAARARALDAGPATGPLYGIPVGVKDIIDTCDQPTRYGSEMYRGHRPTADAWIVRRLRQAGAVIVGKTVTTEFAYFSPGKTANPRRPEHTPGGSSSGSAAAVADAMVPAALGTQTAASVIRPAAYCGVVGFTATPGTFPLAGIKGLSHTLDTLGLLAREVPDVALLRAALLRKAPVPVTDVSAPTLFVWRDTGLGPTDPAMDRALDEAAHAAARSGARLLGIRSGLPSLPDVAEVHATVMTYEAARSLAVERERPELLSPQLLELLSAGDRVSREQYLTALEDASAVRRQLWERLYGVDAVLLPAAPGPAPHGLSATGTPVFSRPWQVMGLPALTVPGLATSDGLPLGVQLVGRPDDDERLLAAGAWLERALRRT
ncbi:amidase [Streptomyces arenae]|uniref:amidase n=1 Tax=Streptomyces arenae TaxID=29301 RepID=UPI0026592626|nr:amidase [Streptomyces arenae]MCG7205103.1 amidase [Streptomyces arenae]